MEEIRLSEHVSVLPGAARGANPSGNPLRIRGGDTTVQIDCSIDAPAPDVDLVLLSHYHEDHVVGLGETSAPVVVHDRDLPAVQSWDGFARATITPTPADEFRAQFRWAARPDATGFDDEAVIDVGGGVRIRVIPLPGHTAGHCGFYVEPDGVFFLADVDLSSFGPVYCDSGSRLSDVRATLARCAEIDAAVYATYHHKGWYTERAVYLEDLAAHARAVDVREARIRELLADEEPSTRPLASDSRSLSSVSHPLGPFSCPLSSVEGLLGRGVVFRIGGRRPWYADAMESAIIAAHLEELE